MEVTRKGVVIRLVTEAVTEKESRRPDPTEVRDLIEDIPAGRRLLWVDDAPSNNSREIQALRALDFTVDTATTNAEALTYAGNGYDLVLSDIGRGQPEAETPA